MFPEQIPLGPAVCLGIGLVALEDPGHQILELSCGDSGAPAGLDDLPDMALQHAPRFLRVQIGDKSLSQPGVVRGGILRGVVSEALQQASRQAAKLLRCNGEIHGLAEGGQVKALHGGQLGLHRIQVDHAGQVQSPAASA